MLINADGDAANLSLFHRRLALKRALNSIEFEYEEEIDGNLKLLDEHSLLKSKEFLDIFGHELKRVVCAQWLKQYEAEGLIFADGVNEDGEVLYYPNVSDQV